MKKYWVIFKNSFQANLTYRADTFLMIFFEVFTLLFLVYLWFSVYNQGNQIGSYSLKNLVFYYIFINFITSSISAWAVSNQMSWIIESGGISNYLIKPIGLMAKMFFDNLGGIMQRLLIHSSLALIIILIFKPFAYSNLFYFAISLIVAIIINFFIFYIIGLTTFYFGVNFGFAFLIFNFITFFSGSLVPLDILPGVFLKISDYLPFKFLAFIPISILNGKIDWNYMYLIRGAVWIFILFLFSHVLYKNGLKRHESYGG